MVQQPIASTNVGRALVQLAGVAGGSNCFSEDLVQHISTEAVERVNKFKVLTHSFLALSKSYEKQERDYGG